MKLSLKALESAVASYVDSSKVSADSFSVVRNNIVGLLDKVGKIYTIDTDVYDKLPELDGDTLSYGKTVEEWQMDMTMPQDWNNDDDGSRALKDYAPTSRPVSYSFSLGKKVFPTSIPYNNIERAVHFEAQYAEIVSKITKKLEDSVSAFRYNCKRQLIGNAIDLIEGAVSGATAYTAGTTALVAGTYYSNSGEVGISMVTASASVDLTWSALKSSGKVILMAQIHTASVPVDESTGEGFIKAVKEEVEKAKDLSEGKSLNGNVLGVEEGLSLYVKQGVMPSVEVDTLAGAFHEEKLALGVEAKAIKDFGSTTSTAFAVLMDSRAIRLFQGYNGTFSNENGYAGRLNIFRHLEFTGHVSRNAFIVIFKPSA